MAEWATAEKLKIKTKKRGKGKNTVRRKSKHCALSLRYSTSSRGCTYTVVLKTSQRVSFVVHLSFSQNVNCYKIKENKIGGGGFYVLHLQSQSRLFIYSPFPPQS